MRPWFAIVIFLCPSLAWAVTNDFNVWINEFHYDDISTDDNEFIEIVAPTSFAALSTLDVTLYNGANGSVYNTFNLQNDFSNTGTSGDFSFYTITLPTNGIQNGSPDGIALTSSVEGVLQFLSYEGTFAAAGGPANGALSTDVGVTEGGSTPDNFSIQRTGTGNSFSDFSGWTAAAHTSGSINTGQTLTALDSGETPGTTPPPPPLSDLVISGVFDGPLSGGLPKGIELFVLNDIADLSIYGVGFANNGGGTDFQEVTLSGSASAGDFIYVASDTTGFQDFFGFAPDFTDSDAAINGDDAVELFLNGIVVDVFGDINVDGTGEPWDYEDGWAYRLDETGPDGTTFILGNWIFSGPNAFDGESTNDAAATPFPIGSFQAAQVPEPTTIAIWAIMAFVLGGYACRTMGRRAEKT